MRFKLLCATRVPATRTNCTAFPAVGTSLGLELLEDYIDALFQGSGYRTADDLELSPRLELVTNRAKAENLVR